MRAVNARQGVAARALEITLLTALRTGEVIGAKWAELDVDRQIWIVPVERSKDRRTRTEAHRIPLSSQVISMLKKLPRLSEYVFPGLKSGRPLSNMAMLSAIKDINCDLG